MAVSSEGGDERLKTMLRIKMWDCDQSVYRGTDLPNSGMAIGRFVSHALGRIDRRLRLRYLLPTSPVSIRLLLQFVIIQEMKGIKGGS